MMNMDTQTSIARLTPAAQAAKVIFTRTEKEITVTDGTTLRRAIFDNEAVAKSVITLFEKSPTMAELWLHGGLKSIVKFIPQHVVILIATGPNLIASHTPGLWMAPIVVKTIAKKNHEM